MTQNAIIAFAVVNTKHILAWKIVFDWLLVQFKFFAAEEPITNGVNSHQCCGLSVEWLYSCRAILWYIGGTFSYSRTLVDFKGGGADDGGGEIFTRYMYLLPHFRSKKSLHHTVFTVVQRKFSELVQRSQRAGAIFAWWGVDRQEKQRIMYSYLWSLSNLVFMNEFCIERKLNKGGYYLYLMTFPSRKKKISLLSPLSCLVVRSRLSIMEVKFHLKEEPNVVYTFVVSSSNTPIVQIRQSIASAIHVTPSIIILSFTDREMLDHEILCSYELTDTGSIKYKFYWA
ncbi:hypothetical protein BC939DRAFT_265878 [Gamsiella multidivaricata]|uniref:uncharacterized protein n=1 Tax=Gamsiella multidivaricata TaxID=101098 RepID=UPI00222051AB|nr:uncharacterized protein BC939DRAFT_265878 [Gamsiella multidivaricata]KAI7819307.1 hypothetical protein BC939DRAFT_265878 [Gamsiella multidivaricata]